MYRKNAGGGESPNHISDIKGGIIYNNVVLLGFFSEFGLRMSSDYLCIECPPLYDLNSQKSWQVDRCKGI